MAPGDRRFVENTLEDEVLRIYRQIYIIRPYRDPKQAEDWEDKYCPTCDDGCTDEIVVKTGNLSIGIV